VSCSQDGGPAALLVAERAVSTHRSSCCRGEGEHTACLACTAWCVCVRVHDLIGLGWWWVAFHECSKPGPKRCCCRDSLAQLRSLCTSSFSAMRTQPMHAVRPMQAAVPACHRPCTAGGRLGTGLAGLCLQFSVECVHTVDWCAHTCTHVRLHTDSLLAQPLNRVSHSNSFIPTSLPCLRSAANTCHSSRGWSTVSPCESTRHDPTRLEWKWTISTSI
jgi:hypothetical protein